jgi:hypothetical protein
MALAPGDWTFVATPAAQADYGDGTVSFTLRCDPGQRRVLLLRRDLPPGAALTVRTTFGVRRVDAGDGGGAALPAADPFLDGIVSSRGRFAVEAPGLPTLILPTWPEPARVLEECRP